MDYYSGRGQQAIDKTMHQRFFKDKMNGTCIECGALDGKDLSVCYAFESILNWNCVNIEADSRSFLKLVVNRPKSLNLFYALSDKDGDLISFCLSPKPKMSHVVDKKLTKSPGVIQVPTITYKTLIEKINLKSLDLFVLDVEKCEIKVLCGMRGAIVLSDVFCIEILGLTSAIVQEKKTKIEAHLALLEDEYVYSFNASYNYVYIKRNFVK